MADTLVEPISFFDDESPFKMKLYMSDAIRNFKIKEAFEKASSPKARITLTRNLLSIDKKLSCLIPKRIKLRPNSFMPEVDDELSPMIKVASIPVRAGTLGWDLTYSEINFLYSSLELGDILTVSNLTSQSSTLFNSLNLDNTKLLTEIDHYVSESIEPEAAFHDYESFRKIKAARSLSRRYYMLFLKFTTAPSDDAFFTWNPTRNNAYMDIGKIFNRKILQLSTFIMLLEIFSEEYVLEVIGKFEEVKLTPTMENLIKVLQDWTYNKDFPLEWILD